MTSATLRRMIARPASVLRQKGQPRSKTPKNTPKPGARKVTVSVLVGPTFAIRVKKSR